VAESCPSQQEIESFLTVARNLDLTPWRHLTKRPERQLDLEWVVLDQKDSGDRRVSG
jgi:hypothetical protein